MVSQNFSSKNNMSSELEKFIKDSIKDAKQGMKREVNKFAEKVKDENLPVGPPKKGKDAPDYFEGKLRDSTRVEFTDTGDEFSATISVGQGIDYTQFALAKKRGEDPWNGTAEAQLAITRALMGKAEPDEE